MISIYIDHHIRTSDQILPNSLRLILCAPIFAGNFLVWFIWAFDSLIVLNQDSVNIPIHNADQQMSNNVFLAKQDVTH